MKKIFLLLLYIINICSAEIYFSPYGGTRQELIRLINSSTQNIDLAIYSFTSKELALALVSAAQNNRKIRLLVDKGQLSAKRSVVEWVPKYLEVRYLPIGEGRGIMHHKFMLIGDSILTTGSYNWTDNAELFNYENLMVLRDKQTISKFQIEFNKMWGQAKVIKIISKKQ